MAATATMQRVLPNPPSLGTDPASSMCAVEAAGEGEQATFVVGTAEMELMAFTAEGEACGEREVQNAPFEGMKALCVERDAAGGLWRAYAAGDGTAVRVEPHTPPRQTETDTLVEETQQEEAEEAGEVGEVLNFTEEVRAVQLLRPTTATGMAPEAAADGVASGAGLLLLVATANQVVLRTCDATGAWQNADASKDEETHVSVVWKPNVSSIVSAVASVAAGGLARVAVGDCEGNVRVMETVGPWSAGGNLFSEVYVARAALPREIASDLVHPPQMDWHRDALAVPGASMVKLFLFPKARSTAGSAPPAATTPPQVKEVILAYDDVHGMRHRGAVQKVLWARNGLILASACNRGSILVWDAVGQRAITRYQDADDLDAGTTEPQQPGTGDNSSDGDRVVRSLAWARGTGANSLAVLRGSGGLAVLDNVVDPTTMLGADGSPITEAYPGDAPDPARGVAELIREQQQLLEQFEAEEAQAMEEEEQAQEKAKAAAAAAAAERNSNSSSSSSSSNSSSSSSSSNSSGDGGDEDLSADADAPHPSIVVGDDDEAVMGVDTASSSSSSSSSSSRSSDSSVADTQVAEARAAVSAVTGGPSKDSGSDRKSTADATGKGDEADDGEDEDAFPSSGIGEDRDDSGSDAGAADESDGEAEDGDGADAAAAADAATAADAAAGVVVAEVEPQLPFQVGSSETMDAEDDSVRRRYLCWNHVGAIISRDEDMLRLVEIEFSDVLRGQNSRFTDHFGFSMAVMSEEGALFATAALPPEEQDEADAAAAATLSEEGVVERLERQAKRRTKGRGSILHYRPFTSLSSTSEWTVTLRGEEESLCLAMGAGWVAVATNTGMIRLFGASGLQMGVFWAPGPIVTMVGQAHLLAVICHSAGPIGHSQNLSYRLLDMESKLLISEGALPLYTGTTMTWAGFCERNHLHVFDSRGMLSMLANSFSWQWHPVLDTRTHCKQYTDLYWPVTVRKQRLLAVLLRGRKKSPDIHPRPVTAALAFELPLVFAKGTTDSGAAAERQLLMRELTAEMLEQELQEASAAEDTETAHNLASQLGKYRRGTEKVVLQLIQDACAVEAADRAVDLARRLTLRLGFEKALVIADHFSLVGAAHRIKLIMNSRGFFAEDQVVPEDVVDEYGGSGAMAATTTTPPTMSAVAGGSSSAALSVASAPSSVTGGGASARSKSRAAPGGGSRLRKRGATRKAGAGEANDEEQERGDEEDSNVMYERSGDEVVLFEEEADDGRSGGSNKNNKKDSGKGGRKNTLSQRAGLRHDLGSFFRGLGGRPAGSGTGTSTGRPGKRKTRPVETSEENDENANGNAADQQEDTDAESTAERSEEDEDRAEEAGAGAGRASGNDDFYGGADADDVGEEAHSPRAARPQNPFARQTRSPGTSRAADLGASLQKIAGSPSPQPKRLKRGSSFAQFALNSTKSRNLLK